MPLLDRWLSFAVTGALLFCVLDGALGDPAPLLIAPNISGQEFCPLAAENPQIVTDEAAEEYCTQHDQNSSAPLRTLLDGIGPTTSPSGHFQLGYVLGLPLMRYYKETGGSWKLDRAAIRTRLRTIAELERPVVVYLSANHFTDGNTKLSDELAANPNNLMWTKNGPLPSDGYYVVSVHAWTLSNFDAPMTRMREDAVRTVIEEICRLPAVARSRIRGISLLGEVLQLYPGFTGDIGYSKPYDVTDYSPKAIAGFHLWLKEKFGDIGALNALLGAEFKSFDEVSPPSKDIKNDAGIGILDHIDAYAAGSVAIQGWAYHIGGGPVGIDIYLDGRRRAAIQANLNRTDVPESNPAIKSPNVGWHYDLDYRAEKPGIHTLDVIATLSDHAPVRLATRQITVADPKQDKPSEIPTIPVAADEPQTVPSLLFYMDGPTAPTQLYYNPLARLWLEYRNVVVTRYIEHFARLTRESCLPHDIIFSHQITPELNSSWNPDLMAVEDSMKSNALYQPGVTLYGGAAFGQAFFDWKAAQGWKYYAVGELHPRSDLSPDQIARMFEDHRANGAVYISPYYFTITPKRIKVPGNEIGRTEIDPGNHDLWSDQFYAGIVATIRRH
jgi:hypothetical protein